MTASQSYTDEAEELVALADLKLRQTVTENPYVPIEPTEPQAYFLTAPVREIMYGGAGGGGKSFALLAAALQYIREPRYAALLLRRTYADLWLPDALIPVSHLWLQGKPGAKWDGVKHEWSFPGGSTLTFGYLQHEQDKFRYKGAAFQFIGFDELTAFTETQYRYLFSRLRRRQGTDVPLRMRSSTNPGDVGHEWVKQRFIDAEETPERLFIPALLEDNPYLDVRAYDESLSELDPVTRAQIRRGDWDVRPEGNLFKREWFPVVERSPAGIVDRVRFWDLAATEPSAENTDPDYTASVLMARDDAGYFYVEDVQEFRAAPHARNERIKATASQDGRHVPIFVEQEPGSSGKDTIDSLARTVLQGYAMRGVRSSGDKVTRAKPFSAASGNRLVRLVRGSWVGRFLDLLTSFPNRGVHDDVVDAADGAHRMLTAGVADWTPEDFRTVFSDPNSEEAVLSSYGLPKQAKPTWES